MTKQTTTVWVENNYWWNDSFPVSLEDFAAWVNDVLADVPPEYMGETQVNVESDSESSSVHLSIWYNRLETDEEEAKREAQARDYAAENEARERAQLQYLLAKYASKDQP